MSDIIQENETDIKDKLNYIGLDLDNIPEFITDFKEIEYRPKQIHEDENTYRVYKYVPINKIEILLTPNNRLNTIQEKLEKAAPLADYINANNEENIGRYTTFLKMLKDVSIKEIEEVEEEQKLFAKSNPYKVKYYQNYLWQIYYSDITNTYFMLVPTQDQEYATFFYLLKKKIECANNKKNEFVYAPICYESYSEEYLKTSQISDLEKYLWLFTNEWSLIYEVRDKKNLLSIQIVGEIDCYENIKSSYKIKISSQDEAINFFKLVKAMFILQTDLPHYFKFDAKVDKNGGLEFKTLDKRIYYEELTEFLDDIYKTAKQKIENLKEENTNLDTEFNNLQTTLNIKEKEYFQKERQIATYLECRKTFFGKIKYFISIKKNKKKQEQPDTTIITEIVKNASLPIKELKEKEHYNLEDVLEIYKNLDEIDSIVKNKRADVKALKNKVNNVELKIKNATLYIKEIDSHEKSIFEFWKFANKDENKMLNQAQIQENAVNNTIEKTFSLEDDLEEFGKQIDTIQSETLNKEELDSIFLTTTNVLEDVNYIRYTINKKEIEKSLENLKNEFENEGVILKPNNVEIFGNIEDDNTKQKILGNKKHRENKKNKFTILEISKNTNRDEYKNKLEETSELIEQSINKIKAPMNIPVYVATIGKLEAIGLQRIYLNPEEAINSLKDENQINLCRINIKKDMPIIFYTNSVYYDNTNKTLPIGMNVNTKGLIDMSKYTFNQTTKDYFRINEELDEKATKIRKIIIYEYDVEQK